MGVFGALNGILKADASNWSAGFKEARDEVDKTSAKSKGFFKDLAALTGKKSDLGQAIKLAAGGGAIGGLTALANEAKQMAVEIAKVSVEYERGDITQRQYFQGIAHSLPIVGGFAAAIDGMIDALTGEAAAAAKAAAAQKYHVEQIDKAIEAEQKFKKETKDLLKDIQKETLHAEQEGILAGIGDETERKIAEIKFKAQNATTAMRDKLAGAVHQDLIDGLNKQKDALKGRMDAENNPSAKAALKDAYNNSLLEYSRLQADKKKLTAAELEWEQTALDNQVRDIEKIKHDALVKECAEQNRLAKLALQGEIKDRRQTLEDEKARLEGVIRGGQAAEQYRIAQTAAVRGDPGHVWLAPDRPEVKAAQEASAKLTTIIGELQQMNRKAPAGGSTDDESNPLY